MDSFEGYGSLSLRCGADWDDSVMMLDDFPNSDEGISARNDDVQDFRRGDEILRLLQIAGPSMIVQFSSLFIFPQTASVVGRTLDTKDLAGFSLGSIVGNLTCTSVMIGALTAADTLLPRKFATQNYAEMGHLATRGFIICALLLLFPMIVGIDATLLKRFFESFGQDPDASSLASRWIRIYLVGVPAMLVFRLTQSWLNAQNSVWPMVYASVISGFFVNPILLKVFVPTLGLHGSAISISITQWVMVAILFLCLVIKPTFYNQESSPKLTKSSLVRALEREPMFEFLGLSLGGVLSLSEWWFWESSCFVSGTLGVVPLVCHTIAYNLVPIIYMPCLGISMALSIRIGHIVVHDVWKAKQLAAWSMLFTTLFGGVVSFGLKIFRLEICKLFTSDEDVIRGCEAIWPKLCCYVFILHIFGINSAILKALGMQWRMAAIICLCLWLGAFPCLLCFAVRHDGGLDVIWNVLPLSYGFMQVLLVLSYATADWESMARAGRDPIPQNSNVDGPYTYDEFRPIRSIDSNTATLSILQ
ncbi:MATE efflux family protein [Nitzschia inconspicua]|uniref:MATE efflux family protein n=1 Tax=Nitzschia inconspicua TaxID=303405 RepID=A0A9K3KS30_9STRA|nr:MATE efflux family protein [Nitzschia inconspicua]